MIKTIINDKWQKNRINDKEKINTYTKGNEMKTRKATGFKPLQLNCWDTATQLI